MLRLYRVLREKLILLQFMRTEGITVTLYFMSIVDCSLYIG